MGTVVYLPNANRQCRDCDCTKAVATRAEYLDARAALTPTATCGECGDRIEKPTTFQAGFEGVQHGHCDDCGRTDELVTCEMTLPGTLGTGKLLLCHACVALFDEPLEA